MLFGCRSGRHGFTADARLRKLLGPPNGSVGSHVKSSREFRDAWPTSAADQTTTGSGVSDVMSGEVIQPRPPPSEAHGDADSSALAGVEDPLPLALTIIETSRVLRLDPRTVRAMVTAGELEGNRRGHAIRVSRASVLDWLRGKRRVPRSKR
jgi:excisionase family DNA binding protein